MPSADDSNDLTSSFTIRELEGKKRLIRLRERALPYRPFELSGSQRNTVDWYPGSPVGTIQVYGAKEEQTTINGMWKDKFLTGPNRGAAPAELNEETTESLPTGEEASGLRSSALTTASDLADAVDSIRCCGSEIEVTWLDKVRRGILEKFTQKWHTGHDLEWEIMFRWSSKGESLDDVKVIDNTATDIGDVPNKVQSKLDTIISTAADIIQQADDRSSDVLQAFDSVSGKIAGLSDDLVDAVVNVSQVLTTPNEALKRVAGILDGIKLEADDLWSIIQDQADGVLLDSGGTLDVVKRSFGELLGIRADGRERADACNALGDLCAQQQQQLLSRITSTVISTFQARDGQDLRQVAQQFYGSSDAWRGLMVYNNLTSAGLRAGQVIFVPAQPPDGGC
jgi:hypothetical protein